MKFLQNNLEFKLNVQFLKKDKVLQLDERVLYRLLFFIVYIGYVNRFYDK